MLSVWFLKCAIWVSVDSEMAWIERKTFKINISNYKTLGFISSHLKKKKIPIKSLNEDGEKKNGGKGKDNPGVIPLQ